MDQNFVENQKCYKEFLDKDSMIDRYRKNNSKKFIMNYVVADSKRFGNEMEKLVCSYLNLLPRAKILDNETSEIKNDESHDARCITLEGRELKIEIKSSRFWGNQKIFKWQHIMKEHEYDILIFIGMDYEKINVFCITKEKFMTHYKKKKEHKFNSMKAVKEYIKNNKINIEEKVNKLNNFLINKITKKDIEVWNQKWFKRSKDEKKIKKEFDENIKNTLKQNKEYKPIVTQQGGAEGQGLWVTSDKILSYLTEINSPEDFTKFINENF